LGLEGKKDKEGRRTEIWYILPCERFSCQISLFKTDPKLSKFSFIGTSVPRTLESLSTAYIRVLHFRKDFIETFQEFDEMSRGLIEKSQD